MCNVDGSHGDGQIVALCSEHSIHINGRIFAAAAELAERADGRGPIAEPITASFIAVSRIFRNRVCLVYTSISFIPNENDGVQARRRIVCPDFGPNLELDDERISTRILHLYAVSFLRFRQGRSESTSKQAARLSRQSDALRGPGTGPVCGGVGADRREMLQGVVSVGVRD